MRIKVLIEYVDPLDNCLPPQIYIREWKEIEVTPSELYKMLSNPIGYVYYKMN